MAQEQARQLLQKGIAAAQAGNRDVARQMLQQTIRLDPENETAWLWLSSVARDNKERIFCLKRLLAINPQNEHAIRGLQRLGIEPTETPSSAPSSVVPTLPEDKHTRLQQEAEEFLRHFNPEPVDQLGIQWVRKQKRRFGEGGAKRLQRTLYAVAALVVIVVVGLVVATLLNVDILGEEGDAVAYATRVPSLTPTLTLTPTQGGPTPTSFPEQMAVPPTQEPPSDLERGDPYGLITPTAIYPEMESFLERAIKDAINDYSAGNYEQAIDVLEEERERSDPHCRDGVVYYEALSYAGLGETSRAISLLQEKLAYETPRGYDNTCKESPLLLAALGYVTYLQNPQSQQAITYSEQALAADSKIVLASLTKARVVLAQGEIPVARSVVDGALLNWPNDTNLLVLAAEIEMAADQPLSALDHLGRALYIEPALYPALKLQAEAYLQLGEAAAAGSAQETQYYGLAVRSAQTLLLYYAGDPEGYLYLAQARLGEGNRAMAETNLLRIIGVEASLPDDAVTVVREARHMLGELYYGEGRLADAGEQFEKIATTETGNIVPEVMARLFEIALALGDYTEARDRLDALLTFEPNNPVYRLHEARLSVELCTFYPDELPRCYYDDMLDQLTDPFINGLASERQRADGYSLRAQARYLDTQRNAALLDENDQRLAYDLALNDVTQALAIRESAVDHYYRGLILDELGEFAQALEEYEWVIYWDALYTYPFRTDEFDQRVARVMDEGREILGEEESAVAPPPGPAATSAPPESSPVPTRTPTQTPTPTATPTATPEPPPAAPEIP